MSVGRAGSPIRFTLFVNPYQRKYYRSYQKPKPLLLHTYKEKVHAVRLPYKKASTPAVKARSPKLTVTKVEEQYVMGKDALGREWRVVKVNGVTYATNDVIWLPLIDPGHGVKYAIK